MTCNLSFARPNPMTRGIDTFYYDLHSAMYQLGDLDDAPFPTAAEFREFLKRFFPDGLSGKNCLDAGCGATAINTRTLLANGADKAVAVDLNLPSVRLVRSRIAARGGENRSANLNLACASLLQLGLHDALFDLIVCSGVVHHTPDPAIALAELYRVARPGAVLYCSAYCFEDSWMHSSVRIWRALAWVLPFRLMHTLFSRIVSINNFVLDHMYVPILWIYREDDFRALLEKTGFRVKESFRSGMDRFGVARFLGRSVSGDGLLRVFVCEKPRA